MNNILIITIIIIINNTITKHTYNKINHRNTENVYRTVLVACAHCPTKCYSYKNLLLILLKIWFGNCHFFEFLT